MARNILQMALPMTVAQLINILYNIVDRMYLGRLPGHLSLTGLGLCLPIISILMGFANLCGMVRFFDINIRQHFYSKELIESLLELANVFKINDEELEMLRPMFGLEGTIEDMCRWFMKKYGLRYLV